MGALKYYWNHYFSPDKAESAFEVIFRIILIAAFLDLLFTIFILIKYSN